MDDYEIHLPEERFGYVSFADISPLNSGFSVCFWLNTTYNGFFIEYKVASEENVTTVLAFYFEEITFRIHLYKTIRYICARV